MSERDTHGMHLPSALRPGNLTRKRVPAEQAVSANIAPRDPIIRCAVYVDGEIIIGEVGYVEAARIAKERGGFVWLGLHAPSAKQFASIAREFDLHPLAVEDAVHAHERPKLERYDNMLFMVLRTCKYVEHETLTSTSDVIQTGQRHGVCRNVFRHHGAARRFRRLHQSARPAGERGPAVTQNRPSCSPVRRCRHDRLLRYLEVANEVEVDLDELEESVFSPHRTNNDATRIYQLKRELLEFKRAVAPLALPVNALSTRPMDLVPESIRDYFRDVNDHLSRVRETVAGLDELLSSILQASIARISLSENEDMRKITSWAAIAAVPTAIAGIYGMNFDKMPELHWTFGYPLVLIVMATICFLLYRGFKRNNWL